MSRLAVITNLHGSQRQRTMIQVGFFTEMGLQRAIYPFKGAVPGQQRLGTKGLLCGASGQQNAHRDVILLAEHFQHNRCTHRSGGDPVVTAGMTGLIAVFAIAGQRIILCQKGHTGAFRTPAGCKRRIHPVPGAFHGKALFGHILHQPLGGQLLFHTQFRVFVQVMGDLLQFRSQFGLDPGNFFPIVHKHTAFSQDSVSILPYLWQIRNIFQKIWSIRLTALSLYAISVLTQLVQLIHFFRIGGCL